MKGGDEKVEEVRVGLLGFRKEVEGLERGVKEREEEVGRLVREREEVRRKIKVGREVVGFEGALKGLEEALVIEGKEEAGNGSDDDDEEDEDDEDEDEEEEGEVVGGMSIAKLRRHVLQYRIVREAETRLGDHPFVGAQAPRMIKVRSTLLLDLSTSLQQAKAAKAASRVVKIMKIYADMGEEAEAVKVLKRLKT